MTRLALTVPFALACLIGVGACGANSSTSSLKADSRDGIAADLALASHARDAQVVVSADEGGPTSAPKQAEHKRIPKPSPRPTERVASQQLPAPAPAPSPVVAPPAPVAPAVQPVAPAAKPQPVQQGPTERQPGVYSTEAQVFSKMPWIRP